MSPITKHIIKAIDKATKIEKARHSDWNDDKHCLKVLVNIDEENEKIVMPSLVIS